MIQNSRWLGGTVFNPRTIRFDLIDGSFLDVQFFPTGRYSLHWQLEHASGTIYRWDNADHHTQIATHPHHFHDGHEENVAASDLPHADPQAALRHVLTFIAARIQKRDETNGSKNQSQ